MEFLKRILVKLLVRIAEGLLIPNFDQQLIDSCCLENSLKVYKTRKILKRGKNGSLERAL